MQKLIYNKVKTPISIQSNSIMRALNMMQRIESVISDKVQDFISEVHEKFGISMEDMNDIWKRVSTEKTKKKKTATTIFDDCDSDEDTSSISDKSKKSKKKNKKSKTKKTDVHKKLSPWLQFSHDQRVILKTTMPDLTFGQISKKISEAWKLLTSDEKKNYVSKTLEEKHNNMMHNNDDTDIEHDLLDTDDHEKSVPVIEKEVPVIEKEVPVIEKEVVVEDSTVTSPPLYTLDQLSSMKTKELKEICDNYHLSKTGKKQELIDRIINCQQSLSKNFTNSDPDDDDDTTVHDDDDHEGYYGTDGEFEDD